MMQTRAATHPVPAPAAGVLLDKPRPGHLVGHAVATRESLHHPAAVSFQSPRSVAGSAASAAVATGAGAALLRLRQARRRRLAQRRQAGVTLCAQAPDTGSASSGRRILIVGGGVGGLAAAGQLAYEGFDVTVFEKNNEIGGRCQSIIRDGFRWDTGPSLLLLPQKYEECFRRMGAKLSDHVTLRRAEPAYRVVFGDNTSLDLLYDAQAMGDQLEAFEPGAKSNYMRFLSLARRMFEMGVSRFIDRPFSTWPEFLDLPGLLPQLFERGWWTLPFLDIAGPYDWLLKKFFADPRIRGIFSFQTMYVGLTPYRAPGAFSLLAGTELTDGVWYPVGGFSGVGSGLERVAKQNGVKVRTSTAVDEVIVEKGRAVGVRIGSEVIRSDAVLVNADLTYAYRNLLKGADANLGPPAAEAEGARESPVADFAKYWSDKTFAAGVISFLWAFDIEVPLLLQHTVFLSSPNEEQQSWRPICHLEDMAQAPNFYVHTPSKTDPTAAPKGKDSVMVLLPVGNMQEMANAGIDVSKPDAYADLRKAGRATIFRRMREAGCGDLEKHLVDEVIRDPQEWKSLYNLDHGAAFGLSCGLMQLAMTRPPPKDENGVEGLYFVGASTRPGNGVPLVMMGAGLVAGQIAEDLAPGSHKPLEQVSQWASPRPRAGEPHPVAGIPSVKSPSSPPQHSATTEVESSEPVAA